MVVFNHGFSARRIISVLESSSVVGEYAVKVVDERRSMLKLARGEATVQQEWVESILEVYVSDGKGRYAVVTAKTDWVRSVEELLRLLESSPENPMYAPLPEPTGSSYRLVDEEITGYLEEPETVDIIDDLELKYLGDAAGMIEFSHTRTHLITSTGGDLIGENTRFNGYIRIFSGDDASGQWSWTSPRYEPGLARKATSHARSLAEECSRLPRTTIEGEYPVLLGPMVAGNLLLHVAEAALAGSILVGASFLEPSKLGEMIASSLLSISDVPREEALPFYAGFDDEGVSTRDKYIIRNGVFETILHNSKTAKTLGGTSTGNAGWIIPRLFQLRVDAGSESAEDLLSRHERIVYVTNNWYTRFQNEKKGLFSTVTRDATFLIEKGEPKACLRRIRLSASMPSLLSSIEGISRDAYRLQWWEIPVPTIVPSVLVRELRITTAELDPLDSPR